jgi:hypothetical protein
MTQGEGKKTRQTSEGIKDIPAMSHNVSLFSDDDLYLFDEGFSLTAL